MTTYYCDIPWKQVWAEFDQWFVATESNTGWPTWDKQRRQIQSILKATIDYRIDYRAIWRAFDNWYDSKVQVNGEPPEWQSQRSKIQSLVQAEADKAVN